MDALVDGGGAVAAGRGIGGGEALRGKAPVGVVGGLCGDSAAHGCAGVRKRGGGIGKHLWRSGRSGDPHHDRDGCSGWPRRRCGRRRRHEFARGFPGNDPQDSVLHSLDPVLLLGLVDPFSRPCSVGSHRVGRLLQRRRSWERGMLLGQPVLWSRDTGPAIVGLFRPSVVLPSWVSDIEPSRQRLILAHEEEHRRAGDGIVRFAIACLLIAFPWNPFLWLHYRRLCVAMELDCDRRVMKSFPHRRWLYGDLLVRFGGRGALHLGLGLTTFAERRSFLERRIGKLLSETPQVPLVHTAFLAFATLFVIGVTVWVPGVAEEPGVEAEAQPVDATPLSVVEFELGVPLRPIALPGVPFQPYPCRSSRSARAMERLRCRQMQASCRGRSSSAIQRPRYWRIPGALKGLWRPSIPQPFETPESAAPWWPTCS